MIPLRASEPVQKFPYLALFMVFIWALVHFYSYIVPDDRGVFLQQVAYVPHQESFFSFWKALFFHESFFALWVTLIYVWCFMPRLFERRNPVFSLLGAYLATALSIAFYQLYHGAEGQVPVLLSQVFVSALLGIAMRGEIWSNVDTLVFGPKLLQVFEVPSYVLVFFWFFYLMIGNLFLAAPFSDALTLYFLPFVAFLIGFVWESALRLIILYFPKAQS